jgi:tetratricopeptide (TPR) repeat protein
VKHHYGLVSLFVFALAAGAQDQQTANITGRLLSSALDLHGYVVELDSLGGPAGPPPQTDIRNDGEFGLRNVPFGEYMLKIKTFHGDVVSQQFVSIHERNSPVEVRLPEAPATPMGGTVSLAQLRHPPARKAVQAAATAQHLAESGRTADAAAELERALRLSPDYAAAHSNLGVQYLRLGRYNDARAEIEKALAVAGPNPIDYGNLAFAFAGLQRLDDAIASARRALALDRNSAPAHYLLGSMLALNPATRGEGVAHLEAAADKLPAARRELEKWSRR